MKLKTKPHNQVIGCPVCGNRAHFAVLFVTFHVQPVRQLSRGKWKAHRPMPKRFEVTVPLVLICSSCTQPLDMPPPDLLRLLNKPAKRTSSKSR